MTTYYKIRAFQGIVATVREVSNAVENYGEAADTLADAWSDVGNACYALERCDEIADFAEAFDEAIDAMVGTRPLPGDMANEVLATKAMLRNLWNAVDSDPDHYPQTLDRPSIRYGEIECADVSCAAWGDVTEALDEATGLLAEVEAYVKGIAAMDNIAALFDIIAQWAEAQLITGNADPGTGKLPPPDDDRVARLEAQVANLAALVERLVMDNARLR